MTSQDKFQEYQTHEELEETCLTHRSEERRVGKECRL